MKIRVSLPQYRERALVKQIFFLIYLLFDINTLLFFLANISILIPIAKIYECYRKVYKNKKNIASILFHIPFKYLRQLCFRRHCFNSLSFICYIALVLKMLNSNANSKALIANPVKMQFTTRYQCSS